MEVARLRSTMADPSDTGNGETEKKGRLVDMDANYSSRARSNKIVFQRMSSRLAELATKMKELVNAQSRERETGLLERSTLLKCCNETKQTRGCKRERRSTDLP